ncbi:hypothetical protein AB0I81_57545 [Nonomuraea sp. NPDC050404]|uniref:TRAFAC clade GTPase domain-containing protein n=1 Tax=Nonomuraea sp. NPDC050404 TaxID=3155783 RepID=UPI0033CDACB9
MVAAPVVALILAGRYVWAAVQVLVLPSGTGQDAHVRRPRQGAGEPAYTSYYLDQVLVDLRSVVRQALAAEVRLLRGPFKRVVEWLITGAVSPQLPLSRIPRHHLAFTAPFGVAALVATVTGVALATVAGVAVHAVHAVFLLVVVAGLAFTVVLLRMVEAARLLVRRIYLRCPYPGCFRPIATPFYRCGSGRHEHGSLRPGQYGVLWRICACDERLPTLLLFKRHRLEARCPHCKRPLPDHLGSAPLRHVPLVGGSSAGKTTLLMAVMASLEWMAAKGEVSMEFAAESSRREYDEAKGRLAAGAGLAATASDVPHAFLVYLGRNAKRRRLLYIYDPRGEAFQRGDSVREQQYLNHTSGVLFVIDPFSAPPPRPLSEADRHTVHGAKPSKEHPDAIYHRFTNELGVILGRRRGSTPVAVVVTKMDAIGRMDDLPPPERAHDSKTVADWLAGTLGLGNLIRSLRHDFGPLRYSAISAYAGMDGAATDADRRAVAASVLWLLFDKPIRS